MNKKMKLIAILLIAVTSSKAFAIAGPIELISLGLPFFRPFEFLALAFVFLIRKLSKKKLILLSLVLYLAVVGILGKPDMWDRVIWEPFKMESLIDALEGSVKSDLIPVNNFQSTVHNDVTILSFQHNDDLDLDGLLKTSGNKKLFIIHPNPARSFEIASVGKTLLPDSTIFYTAFDLDPSLVRILKNENSITKEIIHPPSTKVASTLWVSCVLFFTMLGVAIIFRFALVCLSLRHANSNALPTLPVRVIHLLFIGGIFYIAESFAFLPGSSYRIDSSLIYTSFFLISKNIYLWANLFTYVAIVLCGILLSQYSNAQRLEHILHALRGSRLPLRLNLERKSPLVAGLLALFLTSYFRLNHDEALFLAISILTIFLSDFLIGLYFGKLATDKPRLAKFLLRVLEIRKSEFSSLSTYVPETFGNFIHDNHKVSYLEESKKNPIIYKTWAFSYWIRCFFRLEKQDGKISVTILSPQLTSALEICNRDILFNLHPRWSEGLKIHPQHFSEFLTNPSPVTMDIFRLRYERGGADFQAIKEISGSCHSAFDVTPLLKIGPYLTYVENKANEMTASLPIEVPLKKWNTKLFIAQYFKTHRMPEMIFGSSESPEGISVRALKKLLSSAVKHISGEEQKNYAVFTQVMKNAEKDLVPMSITGNNYGLYQAHLRQSTEEIPFIDQLRKIYQLNYFARINEVNKILEAMDKALNLSGTIWFLHLDEIFSLTTGNSSEYKIIAEVRFKEWSLLKDNQINLGNLLDVEGTSAIDVIAASKCPYISFGQIIPKEEWEKRKGQLILREDNLQPREIPIFSEVKGILLRVGNILSHTSIVCRESGIPLILGELEFKKDEYVSISATGKVARINDGEFIKSYYSYARLPLNFKSSKANRLVEMLSFFSSCSFPFGGVIPASVLRNFRANGFDGAAIAEELLNYFPDSTHKIIIRSSATHEDVDLLTAGQFESRISPFEKKALVRVIDFYLSDKTFDGDLLVQEFLKFDYSGVIFTNSHKFAIEISSTSSAVTSGLRPVQSIRAHDGKLNISGNGLSKLKIEKTLKLAAEIEEFFKGPQDIEFGLLGEKLFVLQSRPLSEQQQNFIESEIIKI